MIGRLVSLSCLLAMPLASAWAIGGEDSPPAPSAPHDITFPAPKEAKLENGLRVLVVERSGLPLVAAQLVILHGAEVDPDDRAGLASMTASLLTKGTESKSAPEIATAIESIGGAIESEAQWDLAAAGIVVKSDKVEEALAILADVVLHPSFKQEEIDRSKTQTLDGLRVALEEPGVVARFVTAKAIFGAGQYGHMDSGTPESVQAIQREDIVKLYQSNYAPGHAALILAGDITLNRGRELAEQFFGEWKRSDSGPEGNKRAEAPSPAARNLVIDMPQAGQASVNVAKPAIQRRSPDYYSALVTSAALGTGFISRLNREIRIKRGLSYGARSSIDARREVGPFVASAQTKNESAAEVATLMQSELKRLGTEPVQGEELKSRQAVLTGNYARGLETNQGFVSKMANLVANNLPLDTLNQFIPAISAVKSEEIAAFAGKFFNAPLSLIIVGKASAFIEPLQKGFTNVEIISQGELDLDKPALRKTK